MTRDQALKALQHICGTKTVRLDVHEHISSPERRAVNSGSYQQLKAEIEAGERRVAEIIAGNAEIQAIYARRKELWPIKEKLNRQRFYYKFEAMKTSGGGRADPAAIGWIMLGSGDTWEEVIEKAKAHEERERIERSEYAKLRAQA